MALIKGWQHVEAIDLHSANRYRVAVKLFMEIIGDRRAGEIAYEDGETFRDQLLRLPASHGKGRYVHALDAIRRADAEGAADL